VLFTGKDFVLIDFEGEPARPLGERRLKRSPVRDVAGMIRSFHYAAYASIVFGGPGRVEEEETLEEWANLWYRAVSGVFLEAYLNTLGPGPLVPQDPSEFRILLDALVLEKAVYELGYEMNNRPEWLVIPIRGIDHVLKGTL
jgi:maltose alpha-D-glucosyltransferase/alpha-amylase